MPAHSDSDVGMRFGIGALRSAAGPPASALPRSDSITGSSSSSTPEWRSSTGFGRPVVPDVNWISAMSGS